MRRGLKAGSSGRHRPAQPRRRIFPDEEGTESDYSPAAAECHLLRRRIFPDEEGTESQVRTIARACFVAVAESSPMRRGLKDADDRPMPTLRERSQNLPR